MNTLSQQEKTDARCLVEAAAWRMQLSESDLDGTPEFDLWLAADPRHRAAWTGVQESWDFVGEQQTAPEVLELRRIALANACEAARHRWTATDTETTSRSFGLASLVKRGRKAQHPSRVAGRGLRRQTIGMAVAASLAATAIAGWFIYKPDVYRTQAGERRVVTLADGSQVQLDSSTELLVTYSAHARDLTLKRGQARFDVAHDVERPFSVLAGGEKVIATGTAFNVDMIGSKLLVTLIEGHLVILPHSPENLGQIISKFTERMTRPNPDKSFARAKSQPAALSNAGSAMAAHGRDEVSLDAGQQLVVSNNGGSNVVPASIERATAWENGQLVFDDEPLASVLEQVNRYSSRPLVLTDEQVAILRISGVFNTGDITGFIDTLTRYLPVAAEERNGSILLSHR